MPVLPDVGSRIVWPGAIAPFSSASSIMRARDAILDRAGRVVGLELGPDAHARLGREPLELDERRVADRLDDVAVATAARAVREPLRHCFRKDSEGGVRCSRMGGFQARSVPSKVSRKDCERGKAGAASVTDGEMDRGRCGGARGGGGAGPSVAGRGTDRDGGDRRRAGGGQHAGGGRPPLDLPAVRLQLAALPRAGWLLRYPSGGGGRTYEVAQADLGTRLAVRATFLLGSASSPITRAS